MSVLITSAKYIPPDSSSIKEFNDTIGIMPWESESWVHWVIQMRAPDGLNCNKNFFWK